MGAGVGILGAVIQPVIGQLISGQGWRHSYIYVGLAVIIISIPMIWLFLRMSPKDKGLQPYGMDDSSEDGKAAESDENSGISFAVAKKSTAFMP